MSTLEQFVSQGVEAQQAVDAIAGKAIPTTEAVDANQDEYLVVPLTAIQESPLNPRKTFDLGALEEMAASMRQLGVLEPLLVRPAKGPTGKRRDAPRFELVAGARRLRAAEIAGLPSVPVRVKHLDDKQVLEVMVVENLQRDGLQPLEEAEGYRVLHEEHGYSVNELAGKIGKSREYVYARLKLRGLTEEARQLLLDRKITPGHAILLARLKPEDQERAIEDGIFGGQWNKSWHRAQVAEEEGHGPDELAASASPNETLPNTDGDKAVSVRELGAWIDDHVRFDAAVPDPIVYAETADTLAVAQEQAEKVVHITHNHHVDPEAKEEGKRTYGPQSWKRADAQRGSKACDESVLGVIVVGPGRGEAFRVCIAKDRCTVHWAAEIRAKKQRAKAAEQGGGKASSQQERWAREEAKRREQAAQVEAARARWQKARPAVLEAVAAAAKKAPTKAGGLLGNLIVEECRGYQGRNFKPDGYVPRGTSAEDLVRHAAFLVLVDEAHSWEAFEEFPKRAKAFGIDVKKIVDQAAPSAGADTQKEKSKASAKGARKPRR